MQDIDGLLASSFKGSGPDIEDLMEKLDTDGLGSKRLVRTIECTSSLDDDFDITPVRGCDSTIELSEEDIDSGEATCDNCGRHIDLSEKNVSNTYRFVTDWDGVRKYLQGRIKDIEIVTNSQKRSLTYLGYRFNGQVLRTKRQGFNDDDQPVQDIVDVHICTERIPEPSRECIKLYGRQACYILAGNAVGMERQFERLNLPAVCFGDLYRVSDTAFESRVSDMFDTASAADELTDLDNRADIADRLYQTHRAPRGDSTPLNEDDFEYIVNTLFNYCFRTSVLYGTSESGLELPDGILTLQIDGEPQTYIWDAKYSRPKKEPYSLDASDQRNMTKYPERIREQSGMYEDDSPVNNFAGFIFITPRLNASDLAGFTSKLAERYRDTEYMSGATVSQFRADALLRLYQSLRDNDGGSRQHRQLIRREVHELLKDPERHPPATEFCEYNEAKHSSEDGLDPSEWPRLGNTMPVVDVTVEDVTRVFDEVIASKNPPQVELDHEFLRQNARRLSR